MNAIYRVLKIIGLFLILALVAYAIKDNYSYLFSKTIAGEIIELERVTDPSAIVSGAGLQPSQLYSFAVAIRDESGQIHTASAEDRQWAVAKKGYCVEAKFYPYPPWNLEKSGTYHNARLIQMMDCKTKAPTTPEPIATATPEAPVSNPAATAPISVPAASPGH